LKDVFKKEEAGEENKVEEFVMTKPEFITGDICTESIAGGNPAVFDPSRKIMPFSYMKYSNEPDCTDPKLPSPTYIHYERMIA